MIFSSRSLYKTGVSDTTLYCFPAFCCSIAGENTAGVMSSYSKCQAEIWSDPRVIMWLCVTLCGVVWDKERLTDISLSPDLTWCHIKTWPAPARRSHSELSQSRPSPDAQSPEVMTHQNTRSSSSSSPHRGENIIRLNLRHSWYFLSLWGERERKIFDHHKYSHIRHHPPS